ncbi:MAG: hypothetical protein ACE5E5_06500 [Phycisphaerae bacterium]
MLRKAFRVLLIGMAVAALAFCVASRFTYIYWRFAPLKTDAWTWGCVLIGSSDTVGIDTATYYTSDPAPSSTLWAINDRVFRVSHKIDTGSVSVNWGESGIQQFAGVKRLNVHMVWWAAMLLSSIAVLFALLGFVSRRQPETAASSADHTEEPSSETGG